MNCDAEKIKRLQDVFHLNFQLTRLYKAYLENFPEIISEEMIKYKAC